MAFIFIAIRRTKFITGKLAKRAFALSVPGLLLLQTGDFYSEKWSNIRALRACLKRVGLNLFQLLQVLRKKYQPQDFVGNHRPKPESSENEGNKLFPRAAVPISALLCSKERERLRRGLSNHIALQPY
jgi:hypothetical protein